MIIYVMINYPYTCLTSDDSVLFNPRMHRQSMDPNRTYMINDSKRIALIGSSITTVGMNAKSMRTFVDCRAKWNHLLAIRFRT